MTSPPGTLCRRFRVSLLLALAEALPRGSVCAVAFVATSAHRSRLPRACALGRRGKGTSVPIDTNWVMCIVREDPMAGGYKGGGGQDGAQSYSTSLLAAR